MAENWDVTQLKGLTEQEALERLRTEGHNELPAAKKDGLLGMLLGVVREPMFLLLISCGVIYLSLGETTDAVMLLGFVFVIIGITFYQGAKRSARWRRCATCPAPGRWSCGTRRRSASSDGMWPGATCWCWPRATGCRRTPHCCKAAT